MFQSPRCRGCVRDIVVLNRWASECLYEFQSPRCRGCVRDAAEHPARRLHRLLVVSIPSVSGLRPGQHRPLPLLRTTQPAVSIPLVSGLWPGPVPLPRDARQHHHVSIPSVSGLWPGLGSTRPRTFGLLGFNPLGVGGSVWDTKASVIFENRSLLFQSPRCRGCVRIRFPETAPTAGQERCFRPRRPLPGPARRPRRPGPGSASGPRRRNTSVDRLAIFIQVQQLQFLERIVKERSAQDGLIGTILIALALHVKYLRIFSLPETVRSVRTVGIVKGCLSLEYAAARAPMTVTQPSG